jgi:simple sugar transport system permease protein
MHDHATDDATAASGAAVRARRGLASLGHHKLLPLAVTVALFLAMYGAGSYLFTGFFALQVFLNFFIDNAFLAVTAIGMTFVILSGGIDLSVGSVIALTTMVSATLVEHHGMSPSLVIPLVPLMEPPRMLTLVGTRRIFCRRLETTTVHFDFPPSTFLISGISYFRI